MTKINFSSSFNRQRNKALDDLQYYSTENLTMTKREEDLEIRKNWDETERKRAKS